MTEKMDVDLAHSSGHHEIEKRIDRLFNSFDGATFSYFQNEVPGFVEKEMERLYGNIYSSVPFFRFRGALENAHTYVDWMDGRIEALIVFRYTGGTIYVLNELISLSSECIRRFVKNIFSMVEDVRCIIFNAIETGSLDLEYPVQRINCSENIVITLPDSSEKYQEGLGKNLRKSLKYYANRIRREHPTYRYEVLEGDAADERCIRKVAAFNVARMAGKRKVSGMTEQEIRKTIGLVRAFGGFVGVTTVDGEICAGEICCRIGSNYFILNGSHNPAFDSYRLGMLSQYMTITEFIRRGGKECHFTWGREEYKYRLLGVRRDLDRIIVYRSHAQFMRHARLAAKTFTAGRIRRARLWLTDPEQKDKKSVRMAQHAIRALRDWKHGLRGVSLQS